MLHRLSRFPSLLSPVPHRDGYPKCCSKNKGNCPNTKPVCECGVDCKGEEPATGTTCTRDDGSCKGALFCSVKKGKCGGSGTCQKMTTGCTMNISQVCGCNGKTYDNACLANAVGVSVASTGACRGVTTVLS